MRKIVLASASERRSRILNECGITHEVMLSGYPEEHHGGWTVRDIVVHNAVKKAEAAALKAGEALVIGADTLVAHGDEAIGKPAGAVEAKRLLRRFSGSRIEVYTGLCVIDTVSGAQASVSDKSEIFVKDICEEEIERYFDLLGPYDKAGGFSIEGVGSLIFDDIRGSYFNILGLPLMALSRACADIGLKISDFIRSEG
jgi:septum formation protein